MGLANCSNLWILALDMMPRPLSSDEIGLGRCREWRFVKRSLTSE
jgi:hypothetical protein